MQRRNQTAEHPSSTYFTVIKIRISIRLPKWMPHTTLSLITWNAGACGIVTRARHTGGSINRGLKYAVV